MQEYGQTVILRSRSLCEMSSDRCGTKKWGKGLGLVIVFSKQKLLMLIFLYKVNEDKFSLIRYTEWFIHQHQMLINFMDTFSNSIFHFQHLHRITGLSSFFLQYRTIDILINPFSIFGLTSIHAPAYNRIFIQLWILISLSKDMVRKYMEIIPYIALTIV